MSTSEAILLGALLLYVIAWLVGDLLTGGPAEEGRGHDEHI